MANQSLNQTIAELNPGPGDFSGYRYDRYISGIAPGIRDNIASQINYTKKTVDDARAAMKDVLDKGGSMEEARKAYLEKLPIKRESLEKVADPNATENHSKIKKRTDGDSKKVKGLTAKKLYK